MSGLLKEGGGKGIKICFVFTAFSIKDGVCRKMGLVEFILSMFSGRLGSIGWLL